MCICISHSFQSFAMSVRIESVYRVQFYTHARTCTYNVEVCTTHSTYKQYAALMDGQWSGNVARCVMCCDTVECLRVAAYVSKWSLRVASYSLSNSNNISKPHRLPVQRCMDSIWCACSIFHLSSNPYIAENVQPHSHTHVLALWTHWWAARYEGRPIPSVQVSIKY